MPAVVPDPREFSPISLDSVSWNRFKSLKAGRKFAEIQEIVGSGGTPAFFERFLSSTPARAGFGAGLGAERRDRLLRAFETDRLATLYGYGLHLSGMATWVTVARIWRGFLGA
jgi:hypothetical protein